MPGSTTPNVAAPTNGQQQRQGQGGGSVWSSTIFRMLTIYFLISFFFKSKTNTTQPLADSTGKALPPHDNLWMPSQRFYLKLYIAEEEHFSDYDNDQKLLWHQDDLYYDWKDTNYRQHDFDLPLDVSPYKVLYKNQTLYCHVYFVKAGYSPNPADKNFDKTAVTYGRNPMNKYLTQKTVFKKNLLSGETNKPTDLNTNPTLENATQTIEIVSFWKPNLTLHLIEDHNRYPRGGIPPQIEQHMQFDKDSGGFYPVLFFNEFWLLRDYMIAINDTVKSLPLSVSYSPFSLMKWQMMQQMDQSFAMQTSMGTSSEGESDEFKRMLLETNPYLLGLTFVVTLLHTVFDFLAFKNDIVFWKNKKNLEGMSVRTIFLNTICQMIIFLYLLDNDTSWVIVISSGIGLLIEAWKIKKAVIVEIDWSKRIPIQFRDRESYASKTKEYDEQAMRYLSYALYPLIVGYAIYSLMYDTHRSWYSWILSSLTGCVYTFGFIMMCPQLFINYKLKSVAHLPWRTFTYKALNTFIDDLFAFIIKMPLMHRLSCFRDDIIFLIYLYQRWIYRVDLTRVNEFGQGGVPDDTTDDGTGTTDASTTTTTTKRKED